MLSAFAEQEYLVVPQLLDAGLAKFIAAELRLMRSVQPGATGDRQVAESFSVYSPMPGETLLQLCQPTIEAATGLSLLPTYSYARIYDTGAELVAHTDHRQCEVSCTICLDFDADPPWAICLETPSGREIAVTQQVGDAVIYRGMRRRHWRTPFQGRWHAQVFLHFVDANGPYTEERFAKRPGIGYAV